MLPKNRCSLFLSNLADRVLGTIHLCQKRPLLPAPSSWITSPAKVAVHSGIGGSLSDAWTLAPGVPSAWFSTGGRRGGGWGLLQTHFASEAMRLSGRKSDLPEVTRGLKWQQSLRSETPSSARTVWTRQGGGWMLLGILPGTAWNGIKYLSVAGGLQRTFEMDRVFMCL